MSKSQTIGEVITLFEEWVPKKLASDWDNVGLQIGSLSTPVKNILVTLDVTEAVINEALENEANLIISHHPLLFKPLKQINFNEPKGKIIQQLIKNDLTVYSAHTNLDVVTGGVNDLLADKLGLKQTRVLVPDDNEFIAELTKDKDEKQLYGLGRMGILPTKLTLKELALQIKEHFNLDGLRVTGSLDQIVEKVAVLGGSGESYYQYAKRLGADVYITGDVSFHHAQDAEAAGLSIIDPGHHIESIMITAVSDFLNQQLETESKVFQSTISTEPFQFL